MIHPVTTVQIGIGYQSFPAHDGTRFFKVGTHHDLQAILIRAAQRLKALCIIHRRVQVVDGAGANYYQKTFVFTIENFFDAATGGRHMVRHLVGNGVQPGQFSRGDQAINARGAQFVGFVHGMSQKFFASSADYREVMGITLNQSLLISSSGHVAPRMA